MSIRTLFTAAAAFAAALSISTAASAKVFYNDYNEQGVWTSYDETNEVYGMKFRQDAGKDGFWLVVSDGPNPKKNVDEYAILYGDLNANRITAYTFDGENSANSYQNGTLLGSYENAFTTGFSEGLGYDATMFSLEVDQINSAFGGDWKGVTQGMQNGIWFHQSAESDFTYGADGSILDYAFADQMFIDRAFDNGYMRSSPNCATNPTEVSTYLRSCASSSFDAAQGGGSVPAPGGLALVLIGLCGLRRIRNRA